MPVLHSSMSQTRTIQLQLYDNWYDLIQKSASNVVHSPRARTSCVPAVHTKPNLSPFAPQPGQILTCAVSPQTLRCGFAFVACQIGITAICGKKKISKIRFSPGSAHNGSFLCVIENKTGAPPDVAVKLRRGEAFFNRLFLVF